MSALPPYAPKTRNPKTHAIIRRELLWQVYAPFGAAAALALGLMVAACLPGAAGARSPLADVSLMFLIMIAAVNGLVMFALLAGLAYLAYLGLRELPFLFKRAQDFVWFVSMQVKSVTTQVDNRVVAVHVSVTTLQRIAEAFRAMFAPGRTM